MALDLDGDGLNDLVSACQGCDDIYVVSGPATGSGPISEPAAATLVMEGDGDLPTAVASGGDLDDDGFGEILVGAFAVDDPWGGVGAVYLLAGPLSGSVSVTEGLTWRGEDPDDNAGSSAVLVDFEGAGRPLLAVGAPNRVGGPRVDRRRLPHRPLTITSADEQDAHRCRRAPRAHPRGSRASRPRGGSCGPLRRGHGRPRAGAPRRPRPRAGGSDR